MIKNFLPKLWFYCIIYYKEDGGKNMAKDEQEEKLKDKHMWDNFGKFLAVIITLVYVIFIANNIFNFIPLGSIWLEIIVYAVYYGPLSLVLIVTFEAVADKNTLIRILFILVWVAIILFSVSPTLWGLIG